MFIILISMEDGKISMGIITMKMEPLNQNLNIHLTQKVKRA